MLNHRYIFVPEIRRVNTHHLSEDSQSSVDLSSQHTATEPGTSNTNTPALYEYSGHGKSLSFRVTGKDICFCKECFIAIHSTYSNALFFFSIFILRLTEILNQQDKRTTLRRYIKPPSVVTHSLSPSLWPLSLPSLHLDFQQTRRNFLFLSRLHRTFTYAYFHFPSSFKLNKLSPFIS